MKPERMQAHSKSPPFSHHPTTGDSSQSEVEFFRLMDYEISRGAQFLALSEGEYVLKTR